MARVVAVVNAAASPRELGGSGERRRAFRGRQAESLRPFIGRWVATRGPDVLVAADSPSAVVAWLNRHGQQAESLFRVPVDKVSAGGAAPA